MGGGSEFTGGGGVTGGEVADGEATGVDSGDGETDEGCEMGRRDWQDVKITIRHAIAPKIQAFRLLNIFLRLNLSHCRTSPIPPV